MDIELLHALQPFAIALALGLLIGIERERSHPPGHQPIGLRSFVLLSLLGALAAHLNEIWIAVSITFFVGAAVIAGYLLSSGGGEPDHPDVGITTEIAAVVTYILGYLAYEDPLITLIIGVVVLIVLLARTRLHQFSRSQLRTEELQATVILLVLAIGIIPFLPNRTIDPWQLFNPMRFGTLLLVIALLQFFAYAGIRIFGSTQGLLLSGFLAGFVSSTTATATLSRQVKAKSATPLLIAFAITLATVAMFIKVLLIVFMASPELFYFASLPSIVTIILFTAGVLFAARYVKITDHFPAPTNPLALGSALRLAIMLAAMLVVVTLAQRLLGPSGQHIVVFLAGMVEMQGVTLAIATLQHHGHITLMEAFNDIGLAVLGSFVSKYIICWSTIRKNSIYTILFLTAMVLVYVIAWMVMEFIIPQGMVIQK